MSNRFTSIPGLLILAASFAACNNDDIQNNLSSAKPKEIIVISQDPTGSGSLIQSLHILEPGGALRWRKESWGIFTGGFAADDVNLYVAGVAADNSKKTIAYNINTGTQVWANSSATESNSGLTVRNDTLYCILTIPNGSGSDGYVAAYNTKTGAQYWKTRITNPNPPFVFFLEGSTVYYIFFEPATVTTRMGAFDINTKTVKWSASLGALFATVPTVPAWSGDRIFVADNVNRMRAYSKTDGTLLWMNPDRKFDQPVYSDGKLYASGTLNSNLPDNGVYCFDAGTGTVKWFQRSDYLFSVTAFANPVNSNIVMAGLDSVYFLKSFHPQTGAQVWRTVVQKDPAWFDAVQYPMSVGEDVYALQVRTSLSGFQRIKSRIFKYNIRSGAILDSIDINRDISGFRILRTE
ncbi:MAG: PQQ-binding-like beta-propeller repeat protein [Chitinophagaceae bacterium]